MWSLNASGHKRPVQKSVLIYKAGCLEGLREEAEELLLELSEKSGQEGLEMEIVGEGVELEEIHYPKHPPVKAISPRGQGTAPSGLQLARWAPEERLLFRDISYDFCPKTGNVNKWILTDRRTGKPPV